MNGDPPRPRRTLRWLVATALLTAVSFAAAANTARFTVNASTTGIPAGSTGNQTVTVTNVGPDAATNAVLTYTPPTSAGITVNSVTAAPGGACTLSGGKYTCPSVANVALNGTVTLTVNITVASSAAVGTSAGSTVKVDSAEFNPGSGTGESLFNIWGAPGVEVPTAAGNAYWYGFDGNYNDTGIKTETGSVQPGTGSKIASEWPTTQAYPPGKYSTKVDTNGNSDTTAYAPYGTATATPAAPTNSTTVATPPSVNLPESTTDARNNRRVWEVRTGISLAAAGPLVVCVPQPDDAMYVAVDGTVVAYANTYNGGVFNSSGGTFAAGYHEVIYRIVNRNNQNGSYEHGAGGFGLLGMGTTAATTAEQASPTTSCNSANYNAFTRVAPASNVTVAAPVADLAVTKTDNLSSVNAGGTTTYTVRVTNNGPSSVTGAALTDTPGTGLTLNSAACTASAGNTCTANPAAFTITLPTLAKGTFYEVNVTASVTATGGSVTNTARVAPPSGTSDPTSVNDTALDTDTVNPVTDLSITKTGPKYAKPGDTFSYTLTVTNNGPSASAASGITVSDTLPDAVTFASSTPAAAVSGRTLTWTLPSLSLGASQPYTVTVTAPGTAALEATPTTRTFTNAASVSVPSNDPTPGNNTSGVVTTQMVYLKPLQKEVRNVTADNRQNGGIARFGTAANGLPTEVLEYCIAFNNSGGAALSSFSVSDAVPVTTTGQPDAYGAGQGVRLIRGTATTYQAFSNPVVVPLGTLAAGESGRVCFQARIN